MYKLIRSLSVAVHLLARKRLPSLLLIIQLYCSLVLVSELFVSTNQIDQVSETYTEKYQGTISVATSEYLSDLDYYTYLYDDGSGYNKLKSFVKSVQEDLLGTYIIQTIQPIEVYECHADLFLDGYEEGYAGNAYEVNGVQMYSIKSLQVSMSFFSHYGIELAEGRMLSLADYLTYTVDAPIPVLVGSDYREYLSIGDRFKCKYLSCELELEVVGILGANAFFYDNRYQNMDSCQRYIILPSIIVETENPTYFDKIRMLQQSAGMIVSDSPINILELRYNKLKEQAGISQWNINIVNPSESHSSNSVFDIYSAMTEQIRIQLKITTLIILLFVIITLSCTIGGIIRSRQYEYGVKILHGATPVSLLLEIIFMVGILVLMSTILATIFLVSNHHQSALVAVYVLSLAIMSIASLYPAYILYNIKLNHVIGGYE